MTGPDQAPTGAPASGELGGDPPCWAHLFDDEDAEECCGGPAYPVVDLAAIDTAGRSGSVWSLPHGGDLDANLVHLEPGGSIGAHSNGEVDVLISVVAGSGELIIDDVGHPLRRHVLALVPKGPRREIRAGADGVTYLSIHRRRGPLGIAARPGAARDT